MQFATSILFPVTATLSVAAAYVPRPQIAIPRRQYFDDALGGISFPVAQVSLKHARIGEQYEANVGGLVLGQGDEVVTFAKASGEDWVEISPEGIISGTPVGPGAGVTELRATSESKSTATLSVNITIREADEALLEELTVISFNLWEGGVNVNNYHEKQLRFILESGADVIGLQESVDGGNAMRLSDALGWDLQASSHDTAILSRYPIVERYDETSAAVGARINLNGNNETKRELNFWSAHPTAYPYGPYAFCNDDDTKERVLEIEAESGRTGQIYELLERIESQLAAADSIPVVLAGDMNAPSHLDWVEALRDKNCGVADFGWPTSVGPREAGLIDSFRVAHPDPVAVQGTTWSPLYPLSEGSTGDPEPQDRIDFIYATKQLEVIGSETVVAGKPKPRPNEKDNEWTSDHAAIRTWFELPK